MESPGSPSPLLLRLAVVAMVAVHAAAPGAQAQRAGGAHPGPAMSGPRGGGFTPANHGSFAGPAATHGPAPASRGPGYGTGQSLFPSPGITSTRPVYYSNGIAHYGTPERRGTRFGYNGGPVGVLSLGYPGYLDFGYDQDFLNPTYNPNTEPVGEGSGLLPDAVINPQPPSMGNYGYPNPGYGQPAYGQPAYSEQAYAAAPGYPNEPAASPAPEPAPTPFLTAPVRRASAPPPAPLPEEDAVTIIFKDGRPPEQIRNYALTRTALYVTAGKVRTIPVDDIDLPATEKANAKAGVDFQLPVR